eukprot:1334567-Prymnesium_polylepis.1
MALGGARVIDRSDVTWVELIFLTPLMCSWSGGILDRVDLVGPDVPLHPPAAAAHRTPEGAATSGTHGHGPRHSETQTKAKAESGRTCTVQPHETREVRTSARTVPAFSSLVSLPIVHCDLC